MTNLPDGLCVVVKQDCPTCVLVEPVLRDLARAGQRLTVLTQDNPAFPAGVSGVVDDTGLERSWRLGIEIVPTLLRIEGGVERQRAIGWHRGEWQAITGVQDIGAGLPEQRPGCGALNADPGHADALALRFGAVSFSSRAIELGPEEDEHEACFERDWTDGLPVVPPTELRVYRMLQGTKRDPKEVLGRVPPDYEPCTVEKVAVNAVMAGCRPEYMPVVIAAVRAFLDEQFAAHSLIATTGFVGPVIVVNGPVRKRLRMNAGVNVLGQGNRANSTIGRALQLTIRNVGGGKPGGIDRSTLGTPGKLGFCFAENEEESCWESLAVERGVPEGVSAVTLFAGAGVRAVSDPRSRTPDSLVRSFAACLRSTHHPKMFPGPDALIVVSPEHQRQFREAGWSKAKFMSELRALATVAAEDILEGLDGIMYGAPEKARGKRVSKLRDGGLAVVHAGGNAGLFSAIIEGWSAANLCRFVTKTVED